MQQISKDYHEIELILRGNNVKTPFIVCSNDICNSFIIQYVKENYSNSVMYTDFKSNPLYEDVVRGIKLFKQNHCDFIIAIGGGSAIDVAKSIKGFVSLDENKNYLEQKIVPNELKFVAVPTTAGTGSESTQFAVIYYNGKKYSVDSEVILPNYVILESKFLETLPPYQKKSTMLDALCQGIESYWSVNSTDESKSYARQAIQIILKNYKQYLLNDDSVYTDMLIASNFSGKAINLSKTTAPHALSYKITSLYGVSHGHAVMICLPSVFDYMISNFEKCTDKRGVIYLKTVFNDLCTFFNCEDYRDLLLRFNELYSELNLNTPILDNNRDLDILVDSVNVERLNNNPITLDKNSLRNIYIKSLKLRCSDEEKN